MFTGLIQGLGKIQPQGRDRFLISIEKENLAAILKDLEIGDSVAVDGVCLTVEEIEPRGFVATASPETLERTNLGQKSENLTYVNLETSLRAGSKIGGHFVTGHVDGTGCLLESVQTDRAWEMKFVPIPSLTAQWSHYIARYIVPKGSIAVNGISLTVADCDGKGNWFTVAVIPHTYAETNLCDLRSGDWVNLEGDILGKYVEKLLGYGSQEERSQEIDLAFLAEHGYQ
ncbi:MAG: riboflavin synthase [Cyanobacteria bacterium SBLK]|nr:riboflavin synthase [Cyanobacteria bacterium SBLK]